MAGLSSIDYIDSLCDEFERLSRSGGTVRLDQFVSTATGADYQTLLPELVALDIELRLQRGEEPTVADYQALIADRDLRFDVSAEIESATQEMRDGSTTTLPRMLGRYRLESKIGNGAFGEVYRSFDTVLCRTVAVKTLRPNRSLTPPTIQHLLDEARKQAGLTHPAVVPVLDYGDEPECHIVSEWIDGETLAELVDRQSTLDIEPAVHIVARVASALDAAHRKGLVHRDVKPSNVLLDQAGNAYLTDFGLAVAEENLLSEPAATVGTYAYMSPEQVRGENQTVDGRSDIYSLGVVLYQLLTGRLPYLARSNDEWRVQIESREPRPLRTINPSIPRGLEAVCLTCLAKRISDRYATAGDLATALRKAVRRRQLPWRAAVAVGAALIVGLAVAWSLPRPDVVFASMTDLGVQHPELKVPDGYYPVAPIEPDSQRVDNEWSISGDAQTVLAFAPAETLMLAVDNYQSGSMEFDVELQQSEWEGGIGIFFGLPDTFDPDRITYKAIVLDKGPGNRAFLHIRSRCGTTRAVSTEIPTLPSGGVRLRIRLEGGSLTSLQLNEHDHSALVTKFNENLQTWAVRDSHTSDCRGTFGLYTVCSSATFKDAHLNDIDVRFVNSVHD